MCTSIFLFRLSHGIQTNKSTHTHTYTDWELLHGYLFVILIIKAFRSLLRNCSNVYIWPVCCHCRCCCCCVLPARLRVAQMGVELRVVAMLTRFPPNWTTVQSQVACDMCSEAYPPRVTHIQMLQGVLLAACNVQLWSKLKPSECSRLSGKQLLKNV